MKKLIVFSLIIISCILLVGCNKRQNTFSLNEEYYKNSSFNELNNDTFTDLISNKKSFAIFIYQPLCSTSNEFNKVLTEFANQYQISFYKMSFTDMKKTELKAHIKYYPSLVIFHKGEIVDYLDANSDSHSEYYKSVEGFRKWFSGYVSIKETNTNHSTILEEEIDTNTKTDIKLENIVYNENKVNIYFFWGNGCPHCEEEFKFIRSIENKYKDYFTLNTFEVWYSKDNAEILKQFADAMGDEISGVPYTIIGNKTFTGFSEKYEEQFLQAIEEQYKNSYDVYFNKVQ